MPFVSRNRDIFQLLELRLQVLVESLDWYLAERVTLEFIFVDVPLEDVEYKAAATTFEDDHVLKLKVLWIVAILPVTSPSSPLSLQCTRQSTSLQIRILVASVIRFHCRVVDHIALVVDFGDHVSGFLLINTRQVFE